MFYNNKDQQEADELADQQALSTQRVRFAVRRGCALDVPRGHLKAGDEVLLSDLADPRSNSSPLVAMRNLVSEGKVLEATDAQLRAANCPKDARFVVGKKALITKGGIIRTPGEQFFPDDDVPGGEAQVLYLCDRGLVVDRKGAA